MTGQINRSTKFAGIQIGHCGEIRISQYADNTILFLDGTERSIVGSIEELHEFGCHSGLKINIGKTSCMPIGITTGQELPSAWQLLSYGIKKLQIVHRKTTNILYKHI